VYLSLRDEIVGLVGDLPYAQMRSLIERPGWTPLPHPAVPVKVTAKKR
jgi:hypothetical protein